MRLPSRCLFLAGVILGLSSFGLAQEANETEPKPETKPTVEQQEESTPQDSAPTPDQEQEANKKEKTVVEMSDMEIMLRVEAILKKLASQQIFERDEAEKELVALGHRALDYLDPGELELSTDAESRIARSRKKLEQLAAESVTKSSMVTFKGEFTLEEALLKIKRQTQNDIGLIEGAPDTLTQKKLTLNFNKTSYWQAISEILNTTRLEIAPYSGKAGQMRIGPSRAVTDATGVPVALPEQPNTQSAVFDIRVTRIDSSRNLRNPQLSHSNMGLLLRWEPRIRPISLMMPIESIKAVDEFGDEIALLNPEGVIAGLVQPEIPEVEFPVVLKLVDRQVEEIESFTARIDAVLPGRIETFKFRNLGKIEAGTQQRRAGAIVTYGGTRKNEDLYEVIVRLGFEDPSGALESHQSWIYSNEIYLINPEGKKIESFSYESAGQDETQVGVTYLFDTDPSDCMLVYKTPAAIVKVPVEFSLKKIPMP